MIEYTLQNIDTIAGTFKVTLFASQAGLVAPAFNTILSISNKQEKADINPGITELSTVQIKLRDDHSTYAEGFWFKVLTMSVEPEIRIYLDEGNGDTFFFWGKVQGEETKIEEHVIGSSFVRTLDITLIPVIENLKNIVISDWITEVLSHEVSTGLEYDGRITKTVKAIDLFNSFLATTFGNGFSTNDCIFVYDGANIDIQYFDGSSWLGFTDVSVPTEFDTWPSPPPPGHNFIRAKYFKSDDPLYLATLYKDPFALFGDLLKNFALKARYLYGKADGTISATPSENRHRLQLLQMGRTFSGFISLSGDVVQSDIPFHSDLVANAVKTYMKPNDASMYWLARKYSGGSYSTPSEISFDLEIPILFYFQPFVEGTASDPGALCKSNGAQFTKTKVYLYGTNSFLEFTTGFATLQALCNYYFNRYPQNKIVYNRTYSKTKASEGGNPSHLILSPLRRLQISDGTTTRNFYANGIEINIEQNETTVEWIEE